jgi:hypothetical protein
MPFEPLRHFSNILQSWSSRRTHQATVEELVSAAEAGCLICHRLYLRGKDRSASESDESTGSVTASLPGSVYNIFRGLQHGDRTSGREEEEDVVPYSIEVTEHLSTGGQYAFYPDIYAATRCKSASLHIFEF